MFGISYDDDLLDESEREFEKQMLVGADMDGFEFEKKRKRKMKKHSDVDTRRREMDFARRQKNG